LGLDDGVRFFMMGWAVIVGGKGALLSYYETLKPLGCGQSRVLGLCKTCVSVWVRLWGKDRYEHQKLG
jgi:hypothetical protein